MFVDNAKVSISAGRGGDGAVSFRHEIYVAKGGPDGGDGGRGGDVIFRATNDLNTLVDFRYQPELKAKPGETGAKSNRHGASGDPLYVKVPVGTIVLRDDEKIADFTYDGQEEIIARGGDGGFGNAHFKSSVRQTPRMAERGEPGEAFEARLELKLLADVGLIGFPNAGKSTFLSVVSNATPEIADYEFTTLTPNLGVAKIDSSGLLIADIPGLIEGASEGKGLGDAFLRHIERTAVLLHMIDAYSDDVADNYRKIRAELEKYDPELTKRPEIIALTKTEGLDGEIIDMQQAELRKVAHEVPIFAISSVAHHGLDEVLRALKEKVDAARAKDETIQDDDEIVTISLNKEKRGSAFRVETKMDDDGKYYLVTGQKIERFAHRTNFDNFEGLNRLRDIMKKMGITHELLRLGAEGDSRVQIGDEIFTMVEQR